MSDPEKELQKSWSIGRLRPWLSLLAERELPDVLRGRVDPSDIVQQTLLQAWRGERDFRGTSHAERLAWLRVILKNTVRQNQRQLATKKRGLRRESNEADRVPLEGQDLADLAIEPSMSASSQLIAAEETLALAEALQRLPEDQRRVIELRHFEGKSHQQIAELMQRSPAAIRMLWVRALRNLK
jgi:RNA polymerase sigma-70 factor, ECF subfamily